MRHTRIALLSLCLGSTFCSVFAADSPESEEKALGEKLERAYALYQHGNIVSLEQKQMQVSFGFVYSNNDLRVPGLYLSAQSLSLQSTYSYGLGSGMQLSATLPYTQQSSKVTIADEVAASTRTSGIADPTIALGKSFGRGESAWTLSGATTLPVGTRTQTESADEATTESIRKPTVTLSARYSTRMRPAFLSGGVGFTHDFTEKENSLTLAGGIGFSLNHALNLGWDIDASLPLGNSTRQNVFMLTTKVAYQAHPDLGIIVSVGTGISPDAPKTALGATAVWTFK